MRFPRQQFIDLMTFAGCPRQMFSELFGLLTGLEAEWLAQGAAREEIELTAFDWDYVPYVECGGQTGPIDANGPQTIFEDAEYLIQRDCSGPPAQAVQTRGDGSASPRLSRPRDGRLAEAEAVV